MWRNGNNNVNNNGWRINGNNNINVNNEWRNVWRNGVIIMA
jgi:hypothetical protein